MNRPSSPLAPTSRELAAGMPLGEQAGQDGLPSVPASLTPRAALEEAVLAGLARPPCYVAFSGGRDSSVILAVADHVARREGLPAPIPATYRFPGDPQADEASWQETVLRHLGLKDWIRRDVRDEFDILGPEGQAVLFRHGVLVPSTTFAQAPLLRQLGGGTLLTGFDGDGLFSGWRWERAADVLGGRRTPRPRDALTLALAAAPASARVAWMTRRSPFPRQPWLRPRLAREVRRAFADELGREPRNWDRRVRWYARRRFFVLPRMAIDLLGSDAGVVVRHPLAAPRFLASVACAGGVSGLGSRTDWLRNLCPDLLPARVIARTDKANMEAAFWGEGTRRFVAEWDGSGVDDALAEPEALQAAWRAREWTSVPLMQLAWLRSRARHQPTAAPVGLGVGP